MECLLVWVKMDEGFIKIKNEVVLVCFCGRKEWRCWHFEDLPFQSLIQKADKFK